jgi:hypothetical protein
MSDKKQTAVEWLFNQIPDHLRLTRSGFEMLQQAKELEKQQIIEAFWNGDNIDCISEQNIKEFAEQYYNETYGGQNND